MTNFISQFVHLMLDKGLSIEDITRMFGVSTPTVQRWIDGINEPHPALQRACLRELRKVPDKRDK